MNVVMSTKSSLKSLFHNPANNEHNPLTMSDEQILDQIYSIHVHSDTKFDVDSLFTLVENTLRRSTHIVDNVVQGSHASLEPIDDKIPHFKKHNQELSHYGQKINIILSKLRKQITLCRQQIDEAEYYRKLRKLFQTPIEIMEVFKVLIFNKDAPQPLFDGATETTVCHLL
ncbi:sieve element occlusion s [Spatholobus suberectus]|nr:sieve element occlusion s [Spatholobus suberectus]